MEKNDLFFRKNVTTVAFLWHFLLSKVKYEEKDKTMSFAIQNLSRKPFSDKNIDGGLEKRSCREKILKV